MEHVMADELINITLEGGKYTIRESAPYQWECLRYGEPWPAFASGPDNLHMALAREVDRLRKMSEPITVEQAREVWENRSNGGCEGMDAGKGGRAWLTGEFQLDELEALCVILRDHAGDRAQGLRELLAIWKQMDEPEGGA